MTDTGTVTGTGSTDLSTVDALRAEPVRLARQLGWFVLSGLACSAAQAVIYLVLRRFTGPAPAGLVALVVTTVLNTESHRRLTFPASRARAGRAHLESGLTAAIVYVVSLALLGLVGWLWTDLTPVWEAVVIAAVTGTMGLLRFTVLRDWVFTDRRASRHRS